MNRHLIWVLGVKILVLYISLAHCKVSFRKLVINILRTLFSADKFVATVHVMVIDEVCEGHHRRARNPPAEAASNHIGESFSKHLGEVVVLGWVRETREITIILWKCFVAEFPLFVKVFFVLNDRSFQNSILKLGQLVYLPQHRDVTPADHFEVRVPKRLIAFKKFVENIHD